jgi:hypothetical protein
MDGVCSRILPIPGHPSPPPCRRKARCSRPHGEVTVGRQPKAGRQVAPRSFSGLADHSLSQKTGTLGEAAPLPILTSTSHRGPYFPLRNPPSRDLLPVQAAFCRDSRSRRRPLQPTNPPTHLEGTGLRDLGRFPSVIHAAPESQAELVPQSPNPTVGFFYRIFPFSNRPPF